MALHQVEGTYTSKYCTQHDSLAEELHIIKTYAIVYCLQLNGILCITTVYSKGGIKYPGIQYYASTASFYIAHYPCTDFASMKSINIIHSTRYKLNNVVGELVSFQSFHFVLAV